MSASPVQATHLRRRRLSERYQQERRVPRNWIAVVVGTLAVVCAIAGVAVTV